MAPIFGHFVQVHVIFRPPRRDPATIELPEGSTVADLCRAVGESTEVVLAIVKGSVVPEDKVLEEGEVTLMSAASGG